MTSIQTRTGLRLAYQDWGQGPTILFAHGWALGADMWEYQMTPLSNEGLRCVAFDRRGCGRSDRPGGGYDLDTLADDVADLIDELDLHDITYVAHSFACAELTRYLTRHGSGRIARAVLVGTTTPHILERDDNPDGIPRAFFEAMIAGLGYDRPAFLTGLAPSFFGANLPGSNVSDELIAWGTRLALTASGPATIELLRTMFESDLRIEMTAFDLPTLLVHGDADQIAPIGITGKTTAAAIPASNLVTYPGGSHGLMMTDHQRFNHDLLEAIGTEVSTQSLTPTDH